MLLAGNLIEEVTPIRIELLNQLDLPRPAPFLELLFARDGAARIGVELGIDEMVDVVSGRESLQPLLPMHNRPAEQVARDADVELAVLAAG